VAAADGRNNVQSFDQTGGNGLSHNPGEVHPLAALWNLSSRLDGSVACGSALKVESRLIRRESDVNNNSRKRVVRTTYLPGGEAWAAPARAMLLGSLRFSTVCGL
jgi:hypothetical protein